MWPISFSLLWTLYRMYFYQRVVTKSSQSRSQSWSLDRVTVKRRFSFSLCATPPRSVISQKFLIEYYENSFDYLIIIMNQLWLTLYLVYSMVCFLPVSYFKIVLSVWTGFFFIFNNFLIILNLVSNLFSELFI